MAKSGKSVTVTLVNKRRVMPETVTAIQKLLDSGKDHGFVWVEPDEMGHFHTFVVSQNELDGLVPPPPKKEAPSQKEVESKMAKMNDAAIVAALQEAD